MSRLKINTYAVTGANGFIKRYLVETLAKNKNNLIRVLVRELRTDETTNMENIIKVKGDLTKPETLHEFIVEDCIVINLAYSFTATSEENIAMTRNLISVCREMKIRRLLHCSTAAVYGRTSDTLVNEESQCSPRSLYGKTKLMIEKMLYESSISNYDFINVRPTAVYGANGQALLKMINGLIHGNGVVNYFR